MPVVPLSPLRSSSHRHTQSSSSVDYFPASPGTFVSNASLQSPPRSPRSPRSPRLFGPPSPGIAGSHNTENISFDSRIPGDFFTAADTGGGLGNLADELADAWEEETGYSGYPSNLENELSDAQQDFRQSDVEDVQESYYNGGGGVHDDDDDVDDDDTEDNGDVGDDGSSCRRDAGLKSPPARYGRTSPLNRQTLQPLKQNTRGSRVGSRHRRQESHYDGSDYGNSSDLEETSAISPGLESQMAEVESLARRGIENNGSDSDYAVARAIEALRDLGAQSGIENSAMRFVSFFLAGNICI